MQGNPRRKVEKEPNNKHPRNTINDPTSRLTQETVIGPNRNPSNLISNNKKVDHIRGKSNPNHDRMLIEKTGSSRFAILEKADQFVPTSNAYPENPEASRKSQTLIKGSPDQAMDVDSPTQDPNPIRPTNPKPKDCDSHTSSNAQGTSNLRNIRAKHFDSSAKVASAIEAVIPFPQPEQSRDKPNSLSKVQMLIKVFEHGINPEESMEVQFEANGNNSTNGNPHPPISHSTVVEAGSSENPKTNKPTIMELCLNMKLQGPSKVKS